MNTPCNPTSATESSSCTSDKCHCRSSSDTSLVPPFVQRRETCKCCLHANPIGFHVPDELWYAAVPERFANGVLCIMCFARLADEALIRWEKDIDLCPVSQAQLHDLPCSGDRVSLANPSLSGR